MKLSADTTNKEKYVVRTAPYQVTKMTLKFLQKFLLLFSDAVQCDGDIPKINKGISTNKKVAWVFLFVHLENDFKISSLEEFVLGAQKVFNGVVQEEGILRQRIKT